MANTAFAICTVVIMRNCLSSSADPKPRAQCCTTALLPVYVSRSLLPQEVPLLEWEREELAKMAKGLRGVRAAREEAWQWRNPGKPLAEVRGGTQQNTLATACVMH